VSLRRIITEEIVARGPMPFSRYMELCLYHPELGYYSGAEERFGKAGDFYTSSDVHAVFGRLLARQFDEMWRALGAPPRLDILELGPGRGLFASDVLAWSAKKFPDCFAALRYGLIESSPSLRRRLEERLRGPIAAGKVWLAAELDLPAPAACAIVFANEFFDALPVEVVDARGQLHIAVEQGRLVETFVPPSRAALDYLDCFAVHPEPGERVEAALAAQQAMQRMGAAFARGFLVAVDYGYTRDELLRGRHRGTVTAFRRHTISRHPYEAPGEQDITAHVNFTALQEAARAAGLAPLGLVTQAQFLVGIGEPSQFADAFEEVRLPQEQVKVTLQLKHLITPAGMGESFRVLVAAKGLEKGKAARLGGLTFA
jgi:SAM-dependent MidA family methyltransferase